ncbi:hypothetical protein KKB64_01550 [Patescibacteria group bacterium]|nr:hypothetical protein [Patescibacteria group bacterium]MBU2460270.1 hypothetical protein [Patescibacteria group bacterium]
MNLEACNCTQCGGPLSSPSSCDWCHTQFTFEQTVNTEENLVKQKMRVWMGEGSFAAALQYSGETGRNKPTLICAYRGDGPEITIRSEGIAPFETVKRLTEDGRIL